MEFHHQSYLSWKTKEFLIINKFYSYSEHSNFKKSTLELINLYLPKDRVYLQDNYKSYRLYLLINSDKNYLGRLNFAKMASH